VVKKRITGGLERFLAGPSFHSAARKVINGGKTGDSRVWTMTTRLPLILTQRIILLRCCWSQRCHSNTVYIYRGRNRCAAGWNKVSEDHNTDISDTAHLMTVHIMLRKSLRAVQRRLVCRVRLLI